MSRPRSSHQRYLSFVRDYKQRRLDDTTEARENQPEPEDLAKSGAELAATRSGVKDRRKRREYLREYLRWLWPHRYAIGGLLVLALIYTSDMYVTDHLWEVANRTENLKAIFVMSRIPTNSKP